MRQRIPSAATGPIAALASLLTVLAAHPALAGDAGPAPAAPARISGYIKAGAEFPDPAARRAARFAPAPFWSGFGFSGRASPGPAADGRGFLKVSGDEGAH